MFFLGGGGACSQGKRGKMWNVGKQRANGDDGQGMIERRDEQLTMKPGLGRRYARWWIVGGGEEGRAVLRCRLTPYWPTVLRQPEAGAVSGSNW